MLTENQVERVARLVRMAPYLPKELQEGLLKLIRDLRVAESAGAMPTSVVADLAAAVPDKLCAEIVQDLRGFGQASPGGFLGPEKKPLDECLRPDVPKEEGPSYLRPERGWVKPQTDDRSTAQTEIFDQMVTALVGGSNDTSKLR